jgi:urease accessory protein
VLNLIRRCPADPGAEVIADLSLTAAARSRSRCRVTTDCGQPAQLSLPRGTLLRHQDLLLGEQGEQVRVLALPEPVLTVTAATPLQLLQAAYHLGNRHIKLEVTPAYLRLEPDPVLAAMLVQLGLSVQAETAPFEPEAGAYGQGAHGHGHSHSLDHDRSHSHFVDAGVDTGAAAAAAADA